MITCLQIHNDYLIPGGETKSAKLIADLLEEKGIKVIRYYKNNCDIKRGLMNRIVAGVRSFYNFDTIRDIEKIISSNKIDFALIHNTSPIISNSVYAVLKKYKIKTIKYIQNYNLLCLNGALDCGAICGKCRTNRLIGVKRACYKGSKLFTLQKLICLKILERKYLNDINAFIAISEFVKNRHIAEGISEEKLHVIYHFCEISEHYSVDQKRYFLYMGRLSKEKGILTLIEAVANNSDLQLVIMGKGPMEEEIHNIINERKLFNIKMIGFKTGTERDKIIQSAKALIAPSEWEEPFGRIVIEAYQFGTPVIVAKNGGLPELVTKESGYVFEPGNVKQLSDKMIELNEMEEDKYGNMRFNASRQIYEKFSREVYFENFCRLLKEIGVDIDA